MTTSHLQHLATLAPELASAAKASLDYWSPEPTPPTVLAGDLARSLVANVEFLRPSTLRSVFDLCETAILEGSAEEQAAFATGFLEGLQHADGRGDFDFRTVAGFLGPTSKAHCQAMDRFHCARTRGL